MPPIEQPLNWTAGLPVFLLVLMSAVFVHELGHFIAAKLAGVKVEEFAIGFPPRLASFKRGETTYAFNLLPLGGYCRMLGEEDPTEPRSLARAPKRWRAIILVAGVTMNMILAVLLFTVAFMTGEPSISGGQVAVRSLSPGSPAESILRENDIILRVNETPLSSAEELRTIIGGLNGQPARFTIQRNGQEQVVTITPRYDEQQQRHLIGVTTTIVNGKLEPAKPRPIGEAFQLGTRTAWNVLSFTADLPRRLIQGQATAEEARPVGLPGIASATTDATTAAVNTGWWFPVFYLAGILNVGLALANILPLPALDGGRLVFVLLEALRGRRISPEKEGLVHLIGFGFLLTIMLITVYFDLTSPLQRVWVNR